MKNKSSLTLSERINQITKKRDEQRDFLFNTTDQTRAKVTTFQNSLYITQIALGIFKNITNRNVAPNKRVQNVVVTIGSILLTELMRKRLSRQEDTPEEAQ